jgi:hypothetical protein
MPFYSNVSICELIYSLTLLLVFLSPGNVVRVVNSATVEFPLVRHIKCARS